MVCLVFKLSRKIKLVSRDFIAIVGEPKCILIVDRDKDVGYKFHP